MMNDLVGREMYGFKSNHSSYVGGRMNDYLGKKGVIHEANNTYVQVKYDCDPNYTWGYPTEEAIQHLVEEEPEIDLKELFNNIKKL